MLFKSPNLSRAVFGHSCFPESFCKEPPSSSYSCRCHHSDPPENVCLKCVFLLLLEVGGSRGGKSGGHCRSLPNHFECLSMKHSLQPSDHPDTPPSRSPEAELLIVSGEPSADTEIVLSLVTLVATTGTTFSDSRGQDLPYFMKCGSWLLSIW